MAAGHRAEILYICTYIFKHERIDNIIRLCPNHKRYTMKIPIHIFDHERTDINNVSLPKS